MNNIVKIMLKNSNYWATGTKGYRYRWITMGMLVRGKDQERRECSGMDWNYRDKKTTVKNGKK
jgi:hypothetical protein